MSAAIVWFRRDLRLIDNPALDAAVQSGLPIVALYVHAPEEEGEWRSGAATDWWLHHSLAALDAQLREHGGRLIVRRGPALAAITQLIGETGAVAVQWNRLYEPAVIARDQVIKQQLKAEGFVAESHNAALFVEPWQVSTQTGQPYRVFTPFWRNAVTKIADVLPLPAPSAIRFADAGLSSAPIESLKLRPTIPWDSGMAATWTPGEQGALARLRDFVDHATRYGKERDRPDLAGTSMLSPHLHFGEVSPRQILAALQLEAQGDPGWMDRVEHYVRELGWREFAHHLLFHYPHTTNANLNTQFDAFPWAEPDAALMRAWQRGRTGIPIVDAGLRQLWETGWMHNRVRMIVASFLTKNLRHHWIHGARWFWDTLVDADLAANTLGWQWAGGTGADAAPYFRIFNPVLQGERFDPDGHYVKRFVPELARVPAGLIHKAWTLKPSEQATFGIRDVYARPVLDLARTRDAALAAYAAIKRS
ncbi:MAG TPA: deoxyribodipyrimidine photo-lyase [Pseudomonadota bacterium]|jgi:deoxyribodipyrimidine photo-lyase|nr:deoxyribodipyrimidine photo-lyase [Pseudomonadota bacterium]